MTSLHREGCSEASATPVRDRLLLVIGFLGLFLAGQNVQAALRPEARAGLGRPVLIAPAEGQRLVESEARFAFRTTAGWRAEELVLSMRPFDSSAWTEVPARPELVTVRADRPVLDLAAAGLTIDAETPLWWCVVARDPGTGKLAASETRSFTALPKFANRIAPSLLLPSPM